MSTNDGTPHKGEAKTADASDTHQTTDNGPEKADLTQFQLIALVEISGIEQAGKTPYGIAIKEQLEDYYGEEVNHGRLYPNLDELAERGLIEKGEIDDRTNSYELTADGRYFLRSHVQRTIGKFGDDFNGEANR
jgi:hypothetical protein